jgi:hypothetical protein
MINSSNSYLTEYCLNQVLFEIKLQNNIDDEKLFQSILNEIISYLETHRYLFSMKIENQAINIFIQKVKDNDLSIIDCYLDSIIYWRLHYQNVKTPKLIETLQNYLCILKILMKCQKINNIDQSVKLLQK